MKKRSKEFEKSTLRQCRRGIAVLISNLKKEQKSEGKKELLSRANTWKNVTQKSHWQKLNQGLDAGDDIQKIILEAQLIIRDYNLSKNEVENGI